MMMYVINGNRTHPEYLEYEPKKMLVSEAKSYGVKGVSKMNRRQLATAILDHLVKQKGNFLSPMDPFERACIK